jgi:hypothetical protein
MHLHRSVHLLFKNTISFVHFCALFAFVLASDRMSGAEEVKAKLSAAEWKETEWTPISDDPSNKWWLGTFTFKDFDPKIVQKRQKAQQQAKLKERDQIDFRDLYNFVGQAIQAPPTTKVTKQDGYIRWKWVIWMDEMKDSNKYTDDNIRSFCRKLRDTYPNDWSFSFKDISDEDVWSDDEDEEEDDLDLGGRPSETRLRKLTLKWYESPKKHKSLKRSKKKSSRSHVHRERSRSPRATRDATTAPVIQTTAASIESTRVTQNDLQLPPPPLPPLKTDPRRRTPSSRSSRADKSSRSRSP